MIMPSKLTNDEYWQHRADDTNAWLDAQEVDTVHRLREAYNLTLFKTESQLYEFFGKYAEDNTMTRQEAMKHLRGVDLSKYRQTATLYRELGAGVNSNVSSEWLRELDEMYAASKVTRMDELKLAVYHEVAKLNDDLESTARPHFETVANYAYENAFVSPSTTLNRPALRQLVDTPFNGYNYSESLWWNTNTLARKLDRTFLQGFTQGLSVREMAQELRKDFNVQRRNAETVIRTDGNNIVNNATLQRYQDAGLNYVRIHVNLDDRTTEICKRHHRENKLYTLEEAQGILPAHYNCRSAFKPDRDELMEEHWLEELEGLDPLEDDDLSWDEKVKAKIKQMDGRTWSLDDVLKTGKAVRESVVDSIIDKDFPKQQEMAQRVVDYQRMNAKVDTGYRRYKAGKLTWDEFDAIQKERTDKFKNFFTEYNENLEISFENDFKKMIDKVRGTGGTFENYTAKSRSTTIDRINSVLDYLPSSWADTLNEKQILGRVLSERSYFTRGNIANEERLITGVKSPSIQNYEYTYGSITLQEDGRKGVAIHELMHMLEDRNENILALEKQFYEKRTAGEELQRLRDVTGNKGYREDELTRVDDFIDEYMGKDYGGRSYELLSMGMERLYSKPGEFHNDKEYADFILGILLTQ